MHAQGYKVGTEHPTAPDPVDCLADTIRGDLEQARQTDEAARECRRRAGRKLARLRTLRGRGWLEGLAIDEGTALLLIEAAYGSKPAHF